MLSPIMRLTPKLLPKIWGGYKLKKIKKIDNQNAIGESFEVSILKDNESLYNGTPLSKFISPKDLPYLIKLIDTSDNLSIQVHPTNSYSKIDLNSHPKDECWTILDSRPDSKIYLGFKENITLDLLKNALAKNEQVDQLLASYHVKRGDFFYVPAGSVHAIGKDILLLEVQQNSGTTFRLWDWNRVDSNGSARDLHIREALEVIDFHKERNNASFFCHQQNILNKNNKIIEHRDFKVESFSLPANKKLTIAPNNNLRNSSIIVVSGSLIIQRLDQIENINPFESILLPYFNAAESTINAIGDSEFILVS